MFCVISHRFKYPDLFLSTPGPKYLPVPNYVFVKDLPHTGKVLQLINYNTLVYEVPNGLTGCRWEVPIHYSKGNGFGGIWRKVM